MSKEANPGGEDDMTIQVPGHPPVKTNAAKLQAAAQAIKAQQLPLFEGEKVFAMIGKLKAAGIELDKDSGIPKIREERRFIVTAQVCGIGHDLIKGILIRAVHFEIIKAEELV